MPGGDGAGGLYGRERELTRIADAVAQLPDRGGVLIVRGSAGVGKSAVLAAATATAVGSGARALVVTGAESEAELPFAGLHQMLVPLLGELDELADPQGSALRVAFGMTEGPAPEVFFVGLAALHLIGLAAARTRLVLIVDDAHWLDRASAAVLAFVARRLDREAVLMLVAEREGHATALDDLGLPYLRLEPLDQVAAGRLLDARAPGLPRGVRERALIAAAGNPLALVELPLTPEGAQAPWLPLTERLRQAFSVRAADLPDAARAVLLMLAIEEGGRVSELIGSAASVLDRPVDLDDVSPAVARGLVEVDADRVRFRHPLMRSAVYQSATDAERHRAHAAMAAAVTGDPDRRAWHRAAAALGPDEAVAAELEAAAARSSQRGAIGVAAAALERAADLSPEPSRRDRRLLRAAELGFELGRADLVDRVVRALDASALSPRDQAQRFWLSGVFDGRRAGGEARLDELLDRAWTLDDRDLSGRLIWSAAIQSWWSDDGEPMRRRIADAASRLERPDDPVPVACLAFSAPIDRAEAILAALPARASDPDVARIYGTAANAIGAFDRSATLLATAADGLRAQGRLGLLARTLTQQAWSAAQRGDLSLALPAAAAAQDITAETRQPTIHATARAIRALVAALRGDPSGVEAHAAAAEGFGLPAGARALLAMVQHARGVSALANGLPVEACEHLERVHDPADPAHHSFLRWLTVADLTEAAVRSGRADAARAAVAALVGVAGRSPVSLVHAGAHYSLALLAGDGDGEARFRQALAATATWPFLRARTQLALGSWLRRQRRPADSRAPLRAARDTFDALGTLPWAVRAREELRASGETSRRRVPEARDQLTPQELEVARLAATGLTNPEIARHLYISHRTVSSHLYKIFPKLGIASRAELPTALQIPPAAQPDGH